MSKLRTNLIIAVAEMALSLWDKPRTLNGSGRAPALLLFFALVLGAASPALAVNCSDSPYFGVIDGSVVPAPDQIQIDMDCTIRNFSAPNVLDTNFSFYTQPGGNEERWLVVFDNVDHTGNMSCNSTHEHKIWFTNGSSTDIQESCQNLLIPVEKIDKRNPVGQTTAAIGEPFTYRLTIPVLYDPASGAVINNSGSLNDLHGITVWDDLNATGADLAYLSHVAYWQGDGTAVPHAFSNTGGFLTFEFPSNFVIPSQDQIIIEITAVLNDAPANVAGTQFINTAKWEFGRLIDDTFYEPLPGEWGQTESMTIADPNLIVTKTSDETALNLGVPVTYTIDAQNTGGGDAWNVTILDLLPDGADAGMCDYDPRTFNPPAQPGVSARIVAGDGALVRELNPGADYSLNYTGPSACQLSLAMTDDAGPVAPDQHLLITYQTQLDADTTADGETLTNIAGATGWFSADSSHSGRRTFARTLSDGTPTVSDHEDSQTVTTALSGYYFQKTVQNLTSHANPAAVAAPGDRLRYKLRLFNVDQTIEEITFDDPLDLSRFDPGTFAMVTLPEGVRYSFNPVSGVLEISGDTTPLSLEVGEELEIEFEITLRSTLSNNSDVLNQASFMAGSLSALSDDPYVNGIAPPGEPADPTRVTIQTPGPLSKANTQPSATIGEQFTYRVTVPANPIAESLYDVRILDDLSLSTADLRFVSASVVSGGAWTLSNTGGSGTDLVIEDTITGIDIPANSQAVIDITVELLNTSSNNSGLSFSNRASYTYNRANGDDATQTIGGEGSTAGMTVVEPAVTAAAKTVRFVTPTGKPLTDPATVGDVLEYVITLPNSGESTAFNTSIVDTLPANLSLIPDSATATINGGAVPGFVANPSTLTGDALAWGAQNDDDTLNIPAGQSLVLTYQVNVVSVTGAEINNSVYADWTSQLDARDETRTGEGCPTTTAPNDYCIGPLTAAVSTLDITTITKSVVEDSYEETPPGAVDPIVRVGDTVTYELTLNLQEYTTRNVVVEDALPAGMALESVAIEGGTPFEYTLAAQPAAGATGTLRWEFGDVFNPPSNDNTPVDPLSIRYVAKVVTDEAPAGLPHEPSILNDNVAKLSYTGGDPAANPERLTATERVDVRQPQMSAISKIDLGTGRLGTGATSDPYQVDIASEVMNFRLSSCNDGLAPAYDVVITDLLAAEFDQSGLTANPPVVRIGAATLTAGTDYIYTAPAAGGEMRVALGTPVDPSECVTVDYDIGFHTDITPNQTWSNEARLPEYWSLPDQGRLYASADTAHVWMTNVARFQPLSKTLVSPAEATIGEEAVYQITVPAAPVNAALDNVVVTDTLHGALAYESAVAVDLNGAAVALTDTSVAPDQVRLTIDRIPAGQQAIITLRARIANNDQAHAGTRIANTASYEYTGMPAGSVTGATSAPLTIVEPRVTVGKAASSTSPKAGDLLTYTLTITASGSGEEDEFSSAFDLAIEDSLSLGLAYVPGSATVDGVVLADPVTNGGDGISAEQTLTWSPASGIDVDIEEGATVTVTYQVNVLDSVAPGQTLTNSVVARWTGLNGDQGVTERTGSGAPAVNDYFTEPFIQTLTAPLSISFVKSVVNETTQEDPGANARPGDTLRYTLVLINESIVPVNGAEVVDELAAQFAPGSLQVLSVSDANADTTNSNAAGGVNGAGIVDIRNLTLGAQGEPDDAVTIEFEATLAAVISNGTTVLNQAQLSGANLDLTLSNQTSTLIAAAPAFEVLKISTVMTGDPAVLMAGETLRYTLTVKNIGNEDAEDVFLRDDIPAHTTYVPGSTTLNGIAVPDVSAMSPLQTGMRINAPQSAEGILPAAATPDAADVATVTFDVVVDPAAVDGLIIENQGFVRGSGVGGGIAPETPSDDPSTPVAGDPTRDIVGNLPLLITHKTVRISGDFGTAGIVDPGDVLLYTITIRNDAATPATGVVLIDQVPVNTGYVEDSLRLNGLAVGADGGVSPLVAGLEIQSSDPPGVGIVSGGSSAEVTFEVRVDDGVPSGTLISNQGSVTSSELPTQPTDADGNPANGYQPTQVVVGDAQQLTITKEVSVLGGGMAQAGGQLEYVIRVTNIAAVPATDVVITDDLSPLGPDPLVQGSATLDGLAGGISYAAPLLTAACGDLPPGATTILRFRANIAPFVPTDTIITNTADVRWNTDQTDSADASITIGGIPGSGILSGRIWHDANLDKLHDGAEQRLNGWPVELYRGSQLLATVLSDGDGLYRFSGLAPNEGTTDFYELRFRAAGAGPNTASLGNTDSPFTDGPQRIAGVTVASGGNLQDLNLPITPNGVVYDSVQRVPVFGARLALLNAATGTPLTDRCFDDPIQQNQTTAADGFYKFDVNFSDPSCPPGGAYLIDVTAPAAGYEAMPSRIIPPASDEASAPFSVPACPGSADDAVPTTAEYCEVTASASVPPLSMAARSDGTAYHLHLTLSNGQIPGHSQVFNNPIPIDPEMNEAVAITKTSPLINVTKGQLVPYTITVNNVFGVPLRDVGIIDRFPAGFKYVEGSARLDGEPREPVTRGRELVWDGLELPVNESHSLQLLLIVGAGVSEGEYVNRAQVLNTATGGGVSGEATATVRVIPDPTFDCTDVIGKVFDDRNLNGYQDDGEQGLVGVRVVTARGLIGTTDEHGRFHITCAVVPDEDRGSNFILKLDDRSLPTGYRVTTENPRVQRATRGKMMKFNFGATIHRVVSIDIADGVFEPGTTELRLQWQPKIGHLLEELRKAPSVLRLSYLGDIEREELVKRRLKALKKEIADLWSRSDGGYRMTVETEVFWRKGGPVR